MKVRDILQQKGHAVLSIKPDDTVFNAIKKMSEHNIGALLVIENERLIGILTERDYRDKVVLMGRQSKNTPVAEIMNDQLYCVTPHDEISHCMKIMTNKRIRHLPVFENQSLTGIISIGDVVKTIINSQKYEIDSLKHYIAGEYPG